MKLITLTPNLISQTMKNGKYHCYYYGCFIILLKMNMLTHTPKLGLHDALHRPVLLPF